jgi:hypothetical protein
MTKTGTETLSLVAERPFKTSAKVAKKQASPLPGERMRAAGERQQP